MVEDREFILEAVKRILPSTTWWGETNHDKKSVENLSLIEDIMLQVLDNLYDDAYVPEDRKGNESYEQISREKRRIIMFTLLTYIIENTSEGDLKYILNTYGYEATKKDKEPLKFIENYELETHPLTQTFGFSRQLTNEEEEYLIKYMYEQGFKLKWNDRENNKYMFSNE